MTDGVDSRSKVDNEGIRPAITGRWVLAQIFGLLRQFGGTLIWVLFLVYLTREIGQTLRAYAGHTSIANLIFSLSAHVSFTVALSLTLAVSSTVLWLLELNRHRKTRERLTARITQLELQIDPGRKSSLLTSRGTTREGDL